MAVPFGFSVGDFVAAIELVTDVIGALKDSTGASAEVRELMTEFYSLETALLAVKNCELEESSREYEAAKQAVGDCQQCMSKFLEEFYKYQHLSAGSLLKRDQLLKIKWALLHKDDVDKLRTKLHSRVSALNLLLNAIHLSRATAANARTAQQLREQGSLLDDVHGRLGQTGNDQKELLQAVEKLLLSSQSSATSRESDFNVRPLRLTGAPIAPDYVERTDVMLAIEQALLPISEEVQKIVVLQGMGGIGKSQLARSYAIKNQRHYTAVFWLNAKSEQSLRTGLAQLAEQILLSAVLDSNHKIRKDEAGIEAAKAEVESWLSRELNCKWLLILDNIDNQIPDEYYADVVATGGTGQSSKFDAYRYIPQISHGSISITSRLSFLARAFGATSVTVEEMSVAEGALLLCKVSHRRPDEPDIEALVQRLGSHPLALSQAGRFMYETKTSPAKYLRQFESRFKSLLKQRPALREYGNGSIMATFSLSYDQLMVSNPSAAAFLMLCSCFDNADLSFDLFTALSRAIKERNFESEDLPLNPKCSWISGLPGDWLDTLCADEDSYLRSITSLYEFSFVRQNERTDGISLHPLVHEWSLNYCDAQGMQDNVAATCNILGANVRPQDQHATKVHYYRVKPHLDRWFGLLGQEKGVPNASVKSITFIAGYCETHGLVDHAILLIAAASRQAEAKFGLFHRITLEAQTAWAVTLMEHGSIKEGMQMVKDYWGPYSRVDWVLSWSREENKALCDGILTVLLLQTLLSNGRSEEAYTMFGSLDVIRKETSEKNLRVSPLITMLYLGLQNLLYRTMEYGEPPEKIVWVESIEQTLVDLDTIETWPSLLGTTIEIRAMLHDKLARVYLEMKDMEKADLNMRKAVKIYARATGLQSSEILNAAHRIPLWGRGILSSVSISNPKWHDTLGALLTRAANDEAEKVDHSFPSTKSRGARKTLSYMRWTDALSTAIEVAKNAPAD